MPGFKPLFKWGGEDMRRTILGWGGLAVAALCALLLYSFSHVSGREIGSVMDISDACVVTVSRYELGEWEKRTDYILDADQIRQLKTLLLESSFTRELASVVWFRDRSQYDIRVEFSNGKDPLLIHCIGNEYIQVTNQFDGKHLTINNKGWKAALDGIIAQSAASGGPT